MCNAEDQAQARERIGHVLERLEPVAPKVCRLLEDAEEGLIAFDGPRPDARRFEEPALEKNEIQEVSTLTAA